MLKDLCFEIIQKCPNNCSFCSSCSSLDKENQISFVMFKKVIDYFMSIGGIEEISLSGGEPLLHPDLFEMISYCHKYRIRTVLFTSGIKPRVKIDTTNCNLSNGERRIVEMLNKFDFSAISKEEFLKLKESGLDKIVFDFQAAQIDTYNELMGTKNQWTFVADSMIRAGMSDIETDVHFIPLKSNYRELPDIIELLNIAEINNLSILNFVPQGRGEINRETLELNDEEMKEFIEIFNKHEKDFKGHIRIGIPLIKEDKHLCTAGLSKLVIKYDGTVLPCPAFKEYNIDDLRRNGIEVFNIYSNLESIEVKSGYRTKPLCKELYGFDKSIK
jgi:MoaA/NifB/PqqE/SkfB family radical SAM enzyme